ncbi:ribonuclease Z [Flavobacteriales bacterium]|nr:ribonuclease Z [Flavobacteriales bacterium]
MNTFEVTILGSGSALPTLKKRPTSQLVQYSNKYLLIDCGEGTQVQLRKAKVSYIKISHIFISHLHGDHYFGLVGLISSMHLLGRVADLYLYAPAELKEIINLQLRASNTQLRFNLVFTELASKETELIYENKDLEVHTIPLKHKILTNGFLIKETPRPRKIKAEKLKFYEVPHYKIDGIKFGEDFVTPEGETVPNEKFTFPPEKARSYAFCSDTAYREKIIPIIKGATMLYHETTFLERDSALAKKTFHSTAKQAGSIAKQSEVGKLLIGHFSARYTENGNTQFIAEVKQEFQNVEIAEELQTFEVG